MLSICATSGLIWLSPLFAKRLRWLPESPRAALSATCAASVACGPLLLSMGAKLSWVSLPANLVLVPIGEILALPLANLLAVVSAISPGLATGCRLATIVEGALRLLEHTATSMQWAVGTGFHYFLPSSVTMALLFLTVLILMLGRNSSSLRARTHWLAAIAGALLSVELAARGRFDSAGLLRISVLDVGQGDSILIDFPNGESMLIDGGGTIASTNQPGKQVVLPLLAARRRWRVDYAVLTHPHPDHFLGLAEVVSEITPREFWFNGVAMDWESAMKARGVRFQTPADFCGKPRKIGDVRIEVFAPCPSTNPDDSANNTSLVLKISYGERSALLVGDAELEEERKLLAASNNLHADFLKVGHHGSKTSTSAEFARAVKPSSAVISCGVRNHFGHPAAATIARLIAEGSAVFRTDYDGEIRWSTDGHTIWLQSAKSE
jgi:competence protein ComEC